MRRHYKISTSGGMRQRWREVVVEVEVEGEASVFVRVKHQVCFCLIL